MTRVVLRPATRSRPGGLAVVVLYATLLVSSAALIVGGVAHHADVAVTTGHVDATSSSSTAVAHAVPTSTPPAPTTASSAIDAPKSGSGVAPIKSAAPGATGVPRGPRSWTWDELADCESGDWDAHGTPIAGSARWDDHRAPYEGGLHFAVSTWDDNKPAGFPDAAYDATREQQIEVGEVVLDRQGPRAWPRCSYMVGMR